MAARALTGRGLLLLVLASGIAFGAPARPCDAATNRASIIIESTPGAPVAHCVGFEGAEASVLDLLERSGVGVRYQDYGGGSVFVCQIGGVGCDYPREGCTCKWASEKKVFWGLYVRRGEEWSFAQAGAGQQMVAAGDVVGWRWGEHDTEDAPPGMPADGTCSTAAAVTVPKADAANNVAVGAGLVAVGMLMMYILVRLSPKKRKDDDEVSL